MIQLTGAFDIFTLNLLLFRSVYLRGNALPATTNMLGGARGLVYKKSSEIVTSVQHDSSCHGRWLWL